MAAIGFVTREGQAFKGELRTLSIRADIMIVPNSRKTGENQPDYRVTSGSVEVGAGWLRRSETSGNAYVSLSLAAPEFGPRRLYANLGRAAGQDDDDTFAIIWNPAD
ncbi:hypothetical protein GCM10011494_24340 [Novosphingobium endophyticum]|uniref:DUF736 domain-containing protein n=1 Tax=Novosphingobium endophyticum TaxID=1955250 RepID=A0A916TTW6_9SPHN|nr:DUF736 family protein [Novosphingobium endophyticum]GGC04925.1 hypothetical protein GCM10011494_24340 [Novosphingobium endophyticum]